MSIRQIIVVSSEEGQVIARVFLDEINNKTAIRPNINCNHFYSFHPTQAINTGLSQIDSVLDDLFRFCKARGATDEENYFWIFLFTPDMYTDDGKYHSSPTFLANIAYIYASYCERCLKNGSIPRCRFSVFYPETNNSFFFSFDTSLFSSNRQEIIEYTYTFKEGIELPDKDRLGNIISSFLANIDRYCPEIASDSLEMDCYNRINPEIINTLNHKQLMSLRVFQNLQNNETKDKNLDNLQGNSQKGSPTVDEVLQGLKRVYDNTTDPDEKRHVLEMLRDLLKDME